MKTILTTAAIAIAIFLVLETHQSARAHQISVTCEAAEIEDAACMSLGPIGAVNWSGVRFWTTKFIDHGVQLPRVIQNAIREWIQALRF